MFNTLKELLEIAKKKGYKWYYDGGTNKTNVNEILKNWSGLDKEGYIFGKQTETHMDIIKNHDHIGTVTTIPPEKDWRNNYKK